MLSCINSEEASLIPLARSKLLSESGARRGGSEVGGKYVRISRLSLLPTPPSASLPPVPARSNYLFAQADDSVGEGDRFSPYFYRT